MEAAVERALRRAGHTTLLFDDRRTKQLVGRRLTQHLALRAARNFAPDFVFLSKCLALDLDTVETILAGRRNAMWYHDPQWFRDLDRPDIAHIASVGGMAQTFFVTGFDEEWRALGLRARFLPAAADAGICPNPLVATRREGVAFIGSGYCDSRARFLVELSRHLPVRVYGPGWKSWRAQLRWNGGTVEGDDFSSVCTRAAIVLGINPANATTATTYASDRVWMVMLGGGFYLGTRTPGMDRLLQEGVHCAWYEGLDECVDVARRYLAEPVERERVRTEGEAHVRAHHTYDQRVSYLLAGEAYPDQLTAASTGM